MSHENISLPYEISDIQRQADDKGHSLVYVGIDGQLAGVLELQPMIRPEIPPILQQLKKRGIQSYIISGDHEQATRTIAQQLGHCGRDLLERWLSQVAFHLKDEGALVATRSYALTK